MRERLMSMAPKGREHLLERRRRMFESMDEKARERMHKHFAYMRQRPSAPDVGSEAPDFNLAVLKGDGDRVRLKDHRGKPVGLIFGSFT